MGRVLWLNRNEVHSYANRAKFIVPDSLVGSV